MRFMIYYASFSLSLVHRFIPPNLETFESPPPAHELGLPYPSVPQHMSLASPEGKLGLFFKADTEDHGGLEA